MGWKPAINFSLRDDETTFGSLIMNTSAVKEIGDCLIKIRDASSPDQLSDLVCNTLYPLLRTHTYTNEEFQELGDNLELVKGHIKDFRRVLADHNIATLNEWGSMQLMGLHYIAGSSTWIDKYINLCKLAATLFFDQILVKCPDALTAEEKQKFQQFYGQYYENQTMQERQLDLIDAWHKDAVMAGDEKADEKRLQMLKDEGFITQESLEAQSKLLQAAMAGVKEAIHEVIKESEEIGVRLVDNSVNRIDISLLEDISSAFHYSRSDLGNKPQYIVLLGSYVGMLRQLADELGLVVGYDEFTDRAMKGEMPCLEVLSTIIMPYTSALRANRESLEYVESVTLRQLEDLKASINDMRLAYEIEQESKPAPVEDPTKVIPFTDHKEDSATNADGQGSVTV